MGGGGVGSNGHSMTAAPAVPPLQISFTSSASEQASSRALIFKSAAYKWNFFLINYQIAWLVSFSVSRRNDTVSLIVLLLALIGHNKVLM